MKSKRLLILICAGLVFWTGRTVLAETRRWTGGAQAVWSDASGWDPLGVPAADDNVVFDTDTAVTADAAFTGIVSVTNGATLTLTAEVDCAVRSAVESGSTLIKTGTGRLTLSPVEGMHAGDIQIVSGPVTFTGNTFGIPSLFGRVSLARGVAAIVEDSPAVTRHGTVMQVRSCAQDGSETTWAICTNRFATYETMNNRWLSGEDGDSVVATSTEDESCVFGSKKGAWFPPPYNLAATDFFQLTGRAVCCLPRTQGYDSYFQVDDYCVIFWDEIPILRMNNLTGIETNVTATAGLHTLDFGFMEHKGDQLLTMRVAARENRLGILAPDTLWNGVCFNGLSLAAGSTLTLTDGSAVGFFAREDDVLEGSVVGGTDAVLSVLGGTSGTLPAALLADFSGRFEIGRYAAVSLAVQGSQPWSFSVIGRGTISIPSNVRMTFSDSLFFGTLEVDSGADVLLTGHAVTNVVVTGTGCVRLDGVETLPRTDSFQGSFLIQTNQTLAVSEPVLQNRATSFLLEDGATLTLNNTVFIADAAKPTVLDGFLTGMWSTNGMIITTDSIAAGSSPVPYFLPNGTAVMTDDIAQRHTIVLTNITVTLDRSWEVSFAYAGSLATQYSNPSPAEGLGFVIQPVGPNACEKSNSHALPGGSEGFLFRTWQDTRGIAWVKNGKTPVYEKNINGISVYNNVPKPINTRIIYDKCGLMTVILEQDGKTYTTSREIVTPSQDDLSRPYWFTFTGGTGYWSEGSGRPCALHTVSNFTGRIQQSDGSFTALYSDPDPAFAFSEANWSLNGKGMTFAEGDDSVVLTPTNFSTYASAFCRTPVKAGPGWRARWTVTPLVILSSAGEDIAFCVHTNAPTVIGTESHTACPKGADGFSIYYYENKFYWVENGVRGNIPPVSLSPFGINLKNTDHVPVTVTLENDGAGRMTVTLTQKDKTFTQTRIFKPSYPAGADLYIGFSTRVSSWCYLGCVLSDAELCYPVTQPLMTPFSVLPGASAEIRTGDPGRGDEAPHELGRVIFGSNAKLTLSPNAADRSDWCLRAGSLVFPTSGTAELVSAAAEPGGVVELDRLFFTGTVPGGVTLSGRFRPAGETLGLAIPDGWKRLPMPQTLADISAAVWTNGHTPGLALLDETGETPIIGRSITVRIVGGMIRLMREGSLFLIR